MSMYHRFLRRVHKAFDFDALRALRRRQHRTLQVSKGLSFECLEDRTMLAPILYLDYGDRLPEFGLVTNVGLLRNAQAPDSPKVDGPDIRNYKEKVPGLNDNTPVELSSFQDTLGNTQYPGGVAKMRQDITALVRRYYAPFGVTVVDLTAEYQNVDSYLVRAAASLEDISQTLGINNRDPHHNDSYVLITQMEILTGNPDQPYFDPRAAFYSGGKSTVADLDGATNERDGTAIAYASASDSAIGLAATVAHEAGHAFGLSHTYHDESLDPTPEPIDPLLMKADIMSYLSTSSSYNFFTNYPVPVSQVPYDRIVNSYRQMAIDDVGNIGPRYNLEYITGTGANNVITISADLQDSTKAVVSVTAYKDATNDFVFSNPLAVPGGDGTMYRYNIEINKNWLIDPGFGTNRILIDFDSLPNAVHSVNLRGMSGRNQLLILGKSGLTGSYSPGTNNTLGLDGKPDLRGTIDIGGTTINLQEFNTNCSINVQDINEFYFNSPTGGATNLTLDTNDVGQQEIHGQVAGNVGFVKITLTNATNLFINGATHDSNALSVDDDHLTNVTIRGGTSGDVVSVDSATGNGTLYFEGGAGADELKVTSFSGNSTLMFDGGAGDDNLTVHSSSGDHNIHFDGGADTDGLELHGDGTGPMTNGSITGLTTKPISWNPATIEKLIVRNGDTRRTVLNNATINGSQVVLNDGVLQGTGTLPALSVEGSAQVKPGTPQYLAFGILNTGNFDLKWGELFTEIQGPVAGGSYDQLKVNGTVALTTAYLTVNFDSYYLPAAGTVFTIIENDGADAIVGKFSGYSEGAVISVNGGGTNLRISYQGGTGNDVTLTVLDNRPSIGSLSVNPGSIKDDNSDLVTLTANNVFSPTGTLAYTYVSFFLDSNGNGAFNAETDRRLGSGVNNGDGRFTWSGPITGVAPGNYKLFARANRYTYHDELFSDPVESTIQVTAAPPVAQVAIPLGAETRINSTTTNSQTRAILGVDSSGNIDAVFTENFASAKLQRYAADGAAIGSNVALAGVAANFGDLAVAPDGSFIVVWDAGNNAFVQRYAANGTAVGSVIQVSTSSQLFYDGSRHSGRIAMDGQGNFIVAWVEGQYFDEDVYFRRYNANGTPRDAAPVRAHVIATDAQRGVDVAMDEAGNFVIAWGNNAGQGAIKARLATNGGTVLGSEFQVNARPGFVYSGDLRFLSVDMTSTGEFAVAFQAGDTSAAKDVYVRRYAADGAAKDAQEFKANATLARTDMPLLGVSESGYVVVAWNAFAQDVGDGNFDRGVYGQVFGPNGATAGGQFHISTTNASYQLLTGLAMDANANFVAAWEGIGDRTGQVDSSGVFLQRFTVNRPPVLGSLPTQLVGANSQRVITVPLSEPNGDTVNLTHIDGQAIISGGFVNLAGGTRVTLNANGTLTYEPRGALAVDASDSFTYTVSDGTLSATGAVNLRITGLIAVASVTPSLLDGALPIGTSPLQIQFSEPALGAGISGNYRLQEAGSDGLLGTTDDSILARSLTSDGLTSTLGGVGLTAGLYRLTVLDAITDAVGQRLDGDRDNAVRGDFVRDFVVSSGFVRNLTSSNDFAFDIVETGMGAGQLLQGTSNAFDGVNRLQVSGQDYAPPLPPVNVTTATLANHLFPTVDGTYRETGFTASFTSDGSPIRLSSLIQMTNVSSAPSILEVDFRFSLDGVAIGQERYDTLIGYDEVVLEHFLANPTPGTHTLGIQMRDRVTGTSVRVDSGSSIQIEQYRAIPNVGPSVALFSTSFASTTTLTNDGLNHDVGSGLTFTADGGPVRLSASVQISNTSANIAVPQVWLRLTVDGVLVGQKRYEYLPAGGYLGVYLEEVVSGLTPGAHTIRIQARNFNNDPIITINAGSSINAVQFKTGPGGPGAIVHAAVSADHYFPDADNVYHDVAPSLTLTSNGSSATASAVVQITNMNSAANAIGQIYARLTVDDEPVGREHYVYLPASGYREIVLSEFLPELGTGQHTIGVQVRNPFANTSVRVDSATAIQVVEYPANSPATLADSGRTVVTPVQTLAGLDIHREITGLDFGGHDFARTLDILANPTESPISTTLRLIGNLGADATTTVFATSDGDLLVEPSDWWVATDDADGSGSPAVVHVVHGPRGLRPSNVEVVGDNIAWSYDVTVPAESAVRLATFTVLGSTRAQAVAAANALVGLSGFGGEAAAFLTPPELATLVNFGFESAPKLIAAISDQNVTEYLAFSFTFTANTFNDIDAGDSLTYVATKSDGGALPSWLTFTATTRTFTGRPQNSDVGTLSIKVTATDTTNLAATDTFDFVVANSRSWTNPLKPLDTDGDGFITSVDALYIINELNDPTIRDVAGRLPTVLPDGYILKYRYDANGDGFVASVDALIVINQLNSGTSGEGESVSPDPLVVDIFASNLAVAPLRSADHNDIIDRSTTLATSPRQNVNAACRLISKAEPSPNVSKTRLHSDSDVLEDVVIAIADDVLRAMSDRYSVPSDRLR